MKKICIFAAQFLPHMGGVERYTYNLACKLVKKGLKVTVVTSNVEGLSSREEMEGFTIYRFPCINFLNGRYPVLKYNREAKTIDHFLKQSGFDFVFVNTRFYIHSLYAVRFAKKINAKCIVVEHGTSHLQMHNRFLDVLGAWYEHGLTAIVKHYCKEYYGVSKACCEWLNHFHIMAKGTLYNAIDLEQVCQLNDTMENYFRDQYNIQEEDIVIAFTGRLLEEKGVISLVKAVQKILEERNDVYLFIAGDGELENWIRIRSNEHIILLGRLEYKDVIGLLKESDIFCLPSFSEGFSTSVLEAVACKCYVVTTKRGGSKELIKTKEYGIVMEDNSQNSVYTALNSVIDDVDKRKLGIQLSYERLEQNYTWDITADKVCQLYNTVL
ncbi:glycosyltransferase family 4 protein [Lachnospiraceae bacterium LCP25S3_G4]